VTGGHAAIFYPDKALSDSFEVFLFTMGGRRGAISFPVRPVQFHITGHFLEYSYVTYLSLLLMFYSTARTGIPPVNLNTVLGLLKPNVLIQQIKEADLIQVNFPWQFEWVYRQNAGRVPIVLVEHNIEFKGLENKTRSPWIRMLANKVKRMEKAAVQQADAIITFTEEDKETLLSVFGIAGEKVRVIPCGVDTDFIRPCPEGERHTAKKQLGLSDKKVVFFAGHLWSANVEAVEQIEKTAGQVQDPNTLFVVVGRVGERFKSHRNILYTGFVKDVRPYFAAADLAINPMVSGTGMNLKMLEFLAAGLPTLTTPTGVRGIATEEDHAFLVVDLKDFADTIQGLLMDASLREALSKKGRALVERKYNWRVIAKQRADLYQTLMKNQKDRLV
jgi:glycosyltransferase involved in cell wall biosynthesis